MKLPALLAALSVLATLQPSSSQQNMIQAKLQSSSSQHVMCYVDNKAQLRTGKAKFLPDHMAGHPCTHIVLKEAELNGTMIMPTMFNDMDDGALTGTYSHITKADMKTNGVKILIAVVGTYNEWSNIINSDMNRREFATNAVKFLKENKFDGIDLHPNVNTNEYLQDNENFLLLLEYLYHAFDAATPKLQLSLSLWVGQLRGTETKGKYFNLKRMSDAVHCLCLMAFNFNPNMRKEAKGYVASHTSPLYHHDMDTFPENHLNANHVVREMIRFQIAPAKIVLGIPTFARTFTLNSDLTSLGAPIMGAGQPGDYTRRPGMLANYELCMKVNAGADMEAIPSQHAYYSSIGRMWLSHETRGSVAEKACYARNNGLGGLAFYTLDMDDFTGTACHGAKFPLVKAAADELKSTGWNCVEKAKMAPPAFTTKGPYCMDDEGMKRTKDPNGRGCYCHKDDGTGQMAWVKEECPLFNRFDYETCGCKSQKIQEHKAGSNPVFV